MSKETSTISWNTELSPFASVIGTNYVPSAEELKSLHALLIPPQQELSRLETEIEKIQSALNDLLSRKRIVLNYLDAHKALASPVRQIPPETLAEIFLHCLPTEYSYATRDLNSAPLILTTICRDWRRVALTTPRLWNSLHIFLPYNLSEDAYSRRCAGAAMWLQRSGSLPLSISLHSNIIAGDQVDSVPQKQLELLIRSLMSFSERFEDIFLSLSSPNLAIFNSLSPPLFSSLVSLRMRNPLPGFFPESAPSPHFSRMPLLRRLGFDGFSVADKNYHSLPCNWRNLTNLVIKDPLNPAQAIAILAETPRMQILSLLISFGVDDGSGVVHLNNLSEIRLTVVDHGGQSFDSFQTGMTSFIHCIECPTLRLLHFSYSPHYDTMAISRWPFQALHTLETLHLSIPLTPNALMDCIPLTPNLTTFQFSTAIWPRLKSPLQDKHLFNLTLSPDNPNPLWPWLQKFSFQFMDTDEPGPLPVTSPISNAAFIAFLGSRCQKTPLKFCDVLYHVDPSFSEVELNTLHSLKQNGLNLRLQLLAEPRHVYPIHRDSPELGLESSLDITNITKRHLGAVDII